MEKKLRDYADYSTLMDGVLSPGVRVIVAKSLKRDLRKVSEWCNHYRMQFNIRKNKTMI